MSNRLVRCGFFMALPFYKDSFEFCSEWHQVESDCLKALALDNSLTKVCVSNIFKVFGSVVVHLFYI